MEDVIFILGAFSSTIFLVASLLNPVDLEEKITVSRFYIEDQLPIKEEYIEKEDSLFLKDYSIQCEKNAPCIINTEYPFKRIYYGHGKKISEEINIERSLNRNKIIILNNEEGISLNKRDIFIEYAHNYIVKIQYSFSKDGKRIHNIGTLNRNKINIYMYSLNNKCISSIGYYDNNMYFKIDKRCKNEIFVFYDDYMSPIYNIKYINPFTIIVSLDSNGIYFNNIKDKKYIYFDKEIFKNDQK